MRWVMIRLYLALLAAIAFLPSAASAVATASSESAQYERVGLCGDIKAMEGAVFLQGPSLPPIRILGLRAGSIQGTGACVSGPDLPRPDETGELQFVAKKVEFTDEMAQLLRVWVAPVKICGFLEKVGDEVVIPYGPGAGQRVFVQRSSPEEAGLNGVSSRDRSFPLCGWSDALPTRRGDGEWQFSPYHTTSDWQRSGFSIGNL